VNARQHKVGIAATAIILALASRAAADPAPATPAPTTPDLTRYLHLQSGSHISTDGGTRIDLPPGYFMDEPTFKKLDVDVRALQDASTSKDAQIKVYRAALEGWRPGWVTLGCAVLGGVALGYYLHEKL
jgi:hypothetical protein